jgi:hypothetical protein
MIARAFQRVQGGLQTTWGSDVTERIKVATLVGPAKGRQVTASGALHVLQKWH